MNWIPTKERLPDELEIVIVYTSSRSTYVALRNRLSRDENDYYWTIVCNCSEGSSPDGEATHWMPLPKPPNEDHHEFDIDDVRGVSEELFGAVNDTIEET